MDCRCKRWRSVAVFCVVTCKCPISTPTSRLIMLRSSQIFLMLSVSMFHVLQLLLYKYIIYIHVTSVVQSRYSQYYDIAIIPRRFQLCVCPASCGCLYFAVCFTRVCVICACVQAVDEFEARVTTYTLIFDFWVFLLCTKPTSLYCNSSRVPHSGMYTMHMHADTLGTGQ